MDAIITILENDGTTRIVPWADIGPLVRQDPQDINDIVQDLRNLPKAYAALKTEVLDLSLKLASAQAHLDALEGRSELNAIAKTLEGCTADHGVGELVERIKHICVRADEAQTMENKLDAIEAVLDGCSADKGDTSDSLPDRVQHVCDRADQAEEYEERENEMSEAMDEILDIARRVSHGH